MKRVREKESDAAIHKANILKALAHPVRVRIFEALAGGEKTVGDIVQIVQEKTPTPPATLRCSERQVWWRRERMA